MQRLIDLINTKQSTKDRILVGIYGIPGSGKTTVASNLQQLVKNSKVVPMDGFHYYKHELNGFQDPVQAHARRGAPFTFDSLKFIKAVQNLHSKLDLSLPGFDHIVGDPVLNQHHIGRDINVVIIEGLYLNLNEKPWSDINDLYDILVMIDVPEQESINRLIKRHIISEICNNEKEALDRVMQNDVPNGRHLLQNQYRKPTIVIKNLF